MQKKEPLSHEDRIALEQEKVVERNKAKLKRERAEKSNKASWERIKKERAIKDMVAHFEKMIEMNMVIAKTGAGYDSLLKENVRFTMEQRIAYLDKNTVYQEVVDYVKRHLPE